MKTEERIGAGKNQAFVVCDHSLKALDAPFIRWLRDEGFQLGDHHFHRDDCPWVFVDITSKRYAYGLPGVQIVRATGSHAITIDEFLVIYSIYKKYEGKDLFVFQEKRFDQDQMQASTGWPSNYYTDPKYQNAVPMTCENCRYMQMAVLAMEHEKVTLIVSDAGIEPENALKT